MSDTTTTAASAPVAPGAEAAATRRRVAIARMRDLVLIPPIIAIAVIGQLVNPVFLTSDNIINVLQTMSEIGMIVLAETIVLVAGKMDLSLESTFGLAPGLAAWLTVEPGLARGLGLLPGGLSVPIALLAGAVIGSSTGCSSFGSG